MFHPTWVAWRGRSHRLWVATIWMVVVSKVKDRLGFGCVFTSWSRLSFSHPVAKDRFIWIWHDKTSTIKLSYHDWISATLRKLHSHINDTECQYLGFAFLACTNLSRSLSESSSSTCTACLWYCSWDSTRDESWLTCSIYINTHPHITSSHSSVLCHSSW